MIIILNELQKELTPSLLHTLGRYAQADDCSAGSQALISNPNNILK